MIHQNPPTVSVVIPLYNKAPYIRQTIESVLCQTMQDFEIIVIDDGSTDRGGGIVQSMENPRIRLIVQENQGVSAARNRGIEEAKAELIAFLDADDLWLDHKLEVQVPVLIKNPLIGMIYCDAQSIDDETGKKLALLSQLVPPLSGNVPLARTLKRNFIWLPTTIVPRKVFEKLGGFDENFKTCEDWEMWIRIMASYSIAYLPDPLVLVRIYSGFTSWENTPDQLYIDTNKLLNKVESNYLHQGKVSPRGICNGRSYLEYYYGLALARSGNYSKALKSYQKALSLNPGNIKAYIRLLQLVTWKIRSVLW